MSLLKVTKKNTLYKCHATNASEQNVYVKLLITM